jgi:coenzyme F420-0:L-glutamate ligase/coenzyme F420-1:gamma-L-glutamate ligase
MPRAREHGSCRLSSELLTSTYPQLRALSLPGIPEVEPGADLALLILEATERARIELDQSHVLVIAQKAVSKSEGRLRALSDVEPGEAALTLADKLDKDPRIVQLVLDESVDVIRAERGVLITRTRQGHVCANAGIDSSNVPGDLVCLLPEDPDESARRIRADLFRWLAVGPAVVISDSFGRPWRLGQVDVAIGCAGLEPLDDRRGRRDFVGRELAATMPAVADEAAAAAGLVRAKEGRDAVVRVEGLARHVTAGDGPGARALLRERADDLFN